MELLKLVGESPWAMGQLVRGVEMAVRKSYRDDGFKPTANETRRRVQICIDTTRILRKDLVWSIDRIVNELPRALRAKLDGLPWDPQTRSIYLANAGDGLVYP